LHDPPDCQARVLRASREDGKVRLMSRINEIADLIERHVPGDGLHASALPRVSLVRSSGVTDPVHTVYRPTLCIVAQRCSATVPMNMMRRNIWWCRSTCRSSAR
jgi:hypothetical protein